MMKIDSATKALFQHPKKRRSWVVYQMQLQGRSLSAVAAANGVARQCLYSAFLRPYPRMEKLIADAVGLAPPVLWPERYDADGLPNRRKGRPQGRGIKNKGSCHGSKDKPARGAGDIQAGQAA